jgi:hypothetical protein
MKLQDQICSEEQSKALVDLGVGVNSLFVYMDGTTIFSPDVDYSEIPEEGFLPALTVAELGILLPERICNDTKYDGFLEIAKRDHVYYIAYTNLFYTQNQNEAYVRSEALIWLLSEKYLNSWELRL